MRSSRFPLFGIAGMCLAIGSVGSSLAAAERFDPITVSTLPAGATVIVDGQVGGITPIVLSLSAKLVHSIRVELEGYHPKAAQVKPELDWGELSKSALGGPLWGIAAVGADLVSGEARRLAPAEIQLTLERVNEVDRLLLPAFAGRPGGM